MKDANDIRKFENFAKLLKLDTTKNGHGYTSEQTNNCAAMWEYRQLEIDKLEHDLKNANCAAHMMSVTIDAMKEKVTS